MRRSYEDGFAPLATMTLVEGQVVTVRVLIEDAAGVVHADAAQLLPAD